MFSQIIHESPEALALDDLSQQRTWAQLQDRTTRLAHFLRDTLSLAPGDHAAVLLENRVEAIEFSLGALMAGIWLTPINHHLTTEEIEDILEDSGAQVLFTDAAHEAFAGTNASCRSILVGDALDAALESASDAAIDPSEPAGANMIYTSGTSGKPKGVKRNLPGTIGQALRFMRQMGEALGLDGSGPHLVTGPLYHAAPCTYAIWDLLNGAPVTIMPHWDAQRALALIADRRIRHTHIVPILFVRLLRLDPKTRARFDLSSLSLVLHGAAPISPSVKRAMIQWWGEILVEYWGSTEGGTFSIISSREWLAHPGSVGKALPNFEVFARDENSNRLGPGEVGTLYCRHKTLPRVFEYHRDPEKTAKAHPAPNLFTVGDIGTVDKDGYIYLCDRHSNLIISGGVNIYPAEIEQVLITHPAIADAGVFGIPNEEWGEEVKAAIELAPGHSPSPALEAKIMIFAAEHLAKYKLPRSIDFEARLPRDPNGKLLIRKLREPYLRTDPRGKRGG